MCAEVKAAEKRRNELRVARVSSSVPAALHPSASSLHVTVTPRGCQKKKKKRPLGDILPRAASPARFSLRLHSIPSVKVEYPPTPCIYQSHHGNLHSGGHGLAFWFSALRWRRLNTNQGSDLLWSFIKRRRLSGSRAACPRPPPSGIGRELRAWRQEPKCGEG